MSTNVRVIVRVRPLLPHEQLQELQCTLLETGGNCVRVKYGGTGDKVFTFDRVLDQGVAQAEVFEEVDPLVDHSLDGLHATIFAYGQTGSGKTFTMEGFDYGMNEAGKLKPMLSATAQEKHGVILRAVDALYAKAGERMQNNSHIRYKIMCSYMQIYNEKVFDLLNPNATLKAGEKRGRVGEGLRIRWQKNDQFSVENLFIFECESAQQVKELFQMGVKNKSMGSHQLNLASSRSHSLFTLYVNSWDPSTADCIIKSELTLVDLAGSEKLGMLAKNPTQKLLSECIDINTSLLALGKVISALADGKTTHVPYRESKLTRLLKHALGGNSMSMMIACVAPCDKFIDETTCTLFYAGRAQNIRNDPRVNEDPKSALIRALKAEIASLKVEVNNYRQLLMEDGRGRPGGTSGSTDKLSVRSVGELPEGEAAYLGEKLVESVRSMRELTNVCSQLRSNFDTINELKVKAEEAAREVNEENVGLRERIELLESIVIQQADDDPWSGGGGSPPAASMPHHPDPGGPATPMDGTGTGGPRKKQKQFRKALQRYHQRYKYPTQPAPHERQSVRTSQGGGSMKRKPTPQRRTDDHQGHPAAYAQSHHPGYAQQHQQPAARQQAKPTAQTAAELWRQQQQQQQHHQHQQHAPQGTQQQQEYEAYAVYAQQMAAYHQALQQQQQALQYQHPDAQQQMYYYQQQQLQQQAYQRQQQQHAAHAYTDTDRMAQYKQLHAEVDALDEPTGHLPTMPQAVINGSRPSYAQSPQRPHSDRLPTQHHAPPQPANQSRVDAWGARPVG